MAKGKRKQGSVETVSASFYEVSYSCEGPGGRAEGTFLTKSASAVDRKVREQVGGPVRALSFACVQREASMPLDDFAAAASPAIEPESVEDVPQEG